MDTPKRVLLVEDDAHIAELLRMHLRDEGYAVVHAADGHAGLRELERGQWDALVLDLMLPGIDGLEICRRALRASASVRRISAFTRTTSSSTEKGLAR
jgi:DNA-binding response OmpR family regulator